MIKLRLKERNCKFCKERFIQDRFGQSVCGVECSIELAKQAIAKQKFKEQRIDRAETKKRLQAYKTLSDWKREAQVAFNAYIRERDKGKPCICCGLDLGFYEVGGAFDCGHYRSVGSAPHLRFHEDNAHGQRKQCNRWGAGRAIDYRIGLIKRIGIKRVEALESDNSVKKYTIDDLKEIIRIYKEKKKNLLKNALI